ncbi:nucleotidyltransferase family protein [Phenylobacterium sp.]|uniref:nucleotidyltransferase family protein n=1 Tax=Phenylobacterium sp. TaxID=1871053 RepID=UPI003982DF1A
MNGFTALVLAGSRVGADPVAAYAGVTHKGLIVLDGQTLLARVLHALDAAGAARICVSSNDPAIDTELAAISLNASVERIEAGASPSLSVAQALEHLGAPLLVTTCDHALLRPEWIRQFRKDAPAEADIAVLLAPEDAVRAAAPQTERTYLAFRDGRYSGCNLFLLRTSRARAAVDLWRRVEAHRKQPWRIALMLGPAMLFGFILRRLTLDGAVRRLGRRAGVAATAVLTPFGLAAVDVDKPADLDLVRALVAAGDPAQRT